MSAASADDGHCNAIVIKPTCKPNEIIITHAMQIKLRSRLVKRAAPTRHAVANMISGGLINLPAGDRSATNGSIAKLIKIKSTSGSVGSGEIILSMRRTIGNTSVIIAPTTKKHSKAIGQKSMRISGAGELRQDRLLLRPALSSTAVL